MRRVDSLKSVMYQKTNVGIAAALNQILHETRYYPPYDVVVKFDPDCEPLTDGILRDVAQAAHDTGAIVSPIIHGLDNQQPSIRYQMINGWPLRITGMVGGIFMAIPAQLFRDGFRYDETGPVWGGDDTGISAWHRARGGLTGYLTTHEANHYRTTQGQHKDYPAYFKRRVSEGGPA